MARGEIVVRIKDGKAFVEARGVKGPACKNLTEELERELGKKVSDRATSEMHERPERLRQNQ